MADYTNYRGDVRVVENISDATNYIGDIVLYDTIPEAVDFFGELGSCDSPSESNNYIGDVRIVNSKADATNYIGGVVSAVLNQNITITSTGDGTGVSALRFEVSAEITVTLDNNAYFYTNETATTGQSQTWTVTPGALRTIYVKCTSGTAKLKISDISKIIKWGDVGFEGWTGVKYTAGHDVNSGSIDANIEYFKNITVLNICGMVWVNHGLNTIHGDISKCTKLTFIRVFGTNTITGDISGMTQLTSYTAGGNNTISGDISNFTNCLQIDNVSIYSAHTGSITNLTQIRYIWLIGFCNVTGSITNLINMDTLFINCDNSISGSINGLAELKDLYILKGNTTLSGDMSNITKIRTFYITSGIHTITYSNWTNLKDLSNFISNTTEILTTDNINQLLADLWANKDEAKSIPTRSINFENMQSRGITGQGLTDLANLRAYRSPGNNAQYALWTIVTPVEVPLLGAEMVDQSNWYNPAYWNVNTVGATNVNNELVFSAAGNLRKDNFWVAGTQYYIQISFDGTSGTLFRPYSLDVSGGVTDLSNPGSARSVAYKITPSGTLATYMFISTGGTPIGKIKTLSIKPVIG